MRPIFAWTISWSLYKTGDIICACFPLVERYLGPSYAERAYQIYNDCMNESCEVQNVCQARFPNVTYLKWPWSEIEEREDDDDDDDSGPY